MHNRINTQHYLRTRFFNTGGIADHSIIKYKYHRLGNWANHNITKYQRLGSKADHNIIKYHSLGGRADHNVTKYHRLGGSVDHNVIKYHRLGGIANRIRIYIITNHIIIAITI